LRREHGKTVEHRSPPARIVIGKSNRLKISRRQTFKKFSSQPSGSDNDDLALPCGDVVERRLFARARHGRRFRKQDVELLARTFHESQRLLSHFLQLSPPAPLTVEETIRGDR